MIFNLEFYSQKNYQVQVFCFFNALTYLGKLSRGKNKIIFKHVPSEQTKKEYMGPQNRNSVMEETLVQTEAERWKGLEWRELADYLGRFPYVEK